MTSSEPPIAFHVLDVLYNDADDDQPVGTIELFGVTLDGQSIKVDVEFAVYFYLLLPDDFQPSMKSELLSFLFNKVPYARRLVASTELVQLHPARPFCFFQKMKLLRLGCRKQQHIQSLCRAFAKAAPNLVLRGREHPLEMFESGVKPVERFNSIHLNPAGLLRCASYKVLHSKYASGPSASSSRRSLTTDLHIHTTLAHLQLDESWSLPAHLVETAFDIETTTLDPCQKTADTDPSEKKPQVLLISCLVRGRRGPQRAELAETVAARLPLAALRHLVGQYCSAQLLEAEQLQILLFTWRPIEPARLPAAVRVIECADEKECITRFRQTFYEEYDTDVLVGHNSSNFDANYIRERAQALGIAEYSLLGKNDQESEVLDSVAKRDAAFVTTPGRVQVDTMDFLRAYGQSFQLVNHKLQTCAAQCLPSLEGIAEGSAAWCKLSTFQRHLIQLFARDAPDMLSNLKGDVPPEKIASYFFSGDAAQIAELGRYCVKDSLLTLRLYVELSMFLRLFTMARTWRVPLQGIMVLGLQDQVVVNMLAQMHSQGMVFNKSYFRERDQKFVLKCKGGLVRQPEEGKYDEPVVFEDFSGMYPAIIMEHNICPSTLIPDRWLTAAQREQMQRLPHAEITVVPYTEKGQPKVAPQLVYIVQAQDTGFLPRIQRTYAALRRHYKALLEKEKDPHQQMTWNCSQLAVKLAQNAMFGFFGVTFSSARFPYGLLAATITQLGRDLNETSVKLTRELFPGARVLYGDTDSIAVLFDYSECKTHQEKLVKAFEWGRALGAFITQKLQSEYLTIVLDKVYSPCCIFQRKKNYSGKKWKSPTECLPGIEMVGGEGKKRDRCPDLRELLQYMNVMLNDRTVTADQIMAHVRSHLLEIAEGKIPFDKFVRTVQLSRDSDQYGKSSDAARSRKGKTLSASSSHAPARVVQPPLHAVVAQRNKQSGRLEDTQKGGRVQFVHILPAKGIVSDARVSDNVVDAALAREQKLKLNFEYYLNQHYLNPLVAHLRLLHVDTSDLLTEPLGVVQRMRIFGNKNHSIASQFAHMPTRTMASNSSSSGAKRPREEAHPVGTADGSKRPKVA